MNSCVRQASAGRALALEDGVLLLLDNEDDVSRNGFRLQGWKVLSALIRPARAALRIRTASSASPRNTIFWLCCMPRSTTTSRIFLSCTTLLPWHCGHLSLSLMTCPAQSMRGVSERPRVQTSPANLQVCPVRTCASALWAHHLHLLNHARCDLSQLDLHALALAGAAPSAGATFAALPASGRQASSARRLSKMSTPRP